MERAEVYRLIDGERAYQDAKWGGVGHDKGHDVDDWLRFMYRYMRYSLEITNNADDLTDPDTVTRVCDQVRRIAALAVACMEVHGAPERDPAPGPATGGTT